MRAHANHQFKFAFAFARVQGSQGMKLSHAAPFLTTVATFLAIVGLSSCAGYTSAAKTGPGTPVTSGSGILSASTITMSFGDVAVGNTATQTLSITNSGTVVVNISQATISGAPFTITSGAPSGAVQVGQTVTIQVQFAPTTSGASNGAISVISDASNSPLAISLSGNGAQAGLSVSPASLTFANAIVGQTSSQTVKLTNTGSSNVVINMATVTGTAFGISGLTLPTTVSVGQAITFTTQFAPIATGAASGSVTFTDNAPNSPQTLTLSATGVATSSTLSASPASVSFETVAVGSTGQQTVTLTNSGNASATISAISATGAGFSVTGLNAPATVAANKSVSFIAHFAPTTSGNVVGNIDVTSNASNSTLSIPLSGSGAQGSLAVSPQNVGFGNVTVGANGSSTITLTNSGSASISISQAKVSGAGFSMSGLPTPRTLTAGQSASFSAKFTPMSGGNASGSISIVSNAPNSPMDVSLSGTGVAAQPQITVSPASLNFGNAAVGSSTSQVVTVSNPGNGPLTVTQLTASGPGYSVGGAVMPLTIAAGSSSTFSATFAPATTGPASGIISVVSNVAGSPTAVLLSGTGVQGQIGASPSVITFGSVAAGQASSQTVTLTNSGTASLTISQATTSGTGFSISGLVTPKSLTAGQSVSFTARFGPTVGGSDTGNISIVSNAPNSPLTIALSGIATQPQLSATPSSASFGNVSTGTSNSQTITLLNGGSSTVMVSSVGVSGAGFSISGVSAPFTIAAGSNAIFNAVFTPATAGAASGSISLVSNAPNSPLAISLTGTGVASAKSLGLSTTNLSFGSVSVGSTNSLSVALTNTGNASVQISNVGVTGAGFAVTGVNNGETLTPNQSVTVTVQFAPTAVGAVSGAITISSDATNSPATINVSGTGSSNVPHTVALNWTASTLPVSGYNVYRGTTPSGPYSTKLNTTLVGAAQFTDSTVVSGQTYYYVVTAVDSSDAESAYSNQATAIIP